MTDKKKNLPIHSSAAEYLTFVAATGESDASYTDYFRLSKESKEKGVERMFI